MTGAEFVAECLSQEGVSKVFGQCGHTNLRADRRPPQGGDRLRVLPARAARRACRRRVFPHLAQARGRPGASLAGPHERPDRRRDGRRGPDPDGGDLGQHARLTTTPAKPHQCIRFHADASQGDIFRPVCKRVWRVDDPQLLPDVLPRALNLAQSGRPGAVLIDVPMDVFSRPVKARVPDTRSRRPSPASDGRRRRRDRRGRGAAAPGDPPRDLRRQRRPSSRRPGASSGLWRSTWVSPWRRL